MGAFWAVTSHSSIALSKGTAVQASDYIGLTQWTNILRDTFERAHVRIFLSFNLLFFSSSFPLTSLGKPWFVYVPFLRWFCSPLIFKSITRVKLLKTLRPLSFKTCDWSQNVHLKNSFWSTACNCSADSFCNRAGRLRPVRGTHGNMLFHWFSLLFS